jgi:BirA family biotin operon repressor/biotin-[acetyl-CoA-carboxylase] ligase
VFRNLSAGRIESLLRTRRIGRSVLCFGEVASTNDLCWSSTPQGDTDGLVVLAESQRNGRGRHGKGWQSPPGENLLMSTLLIDGRLCLAHEPLTIAAGLAVAEGIQRACGVNAQLKWPNDLLMNGAKLAGVIVERRQVDVSTASVIGVGVNVHSAPGRDAIDQPATCLGDHVESLPAPHVLVAAILDRLDHWVHAVACEQLDQLHRQWVSRCGMLQQRLRVRCGRDLYEGRVLDVDPLSGLVLIDDHGMRVHLPANRSTILRP